MHQVRPRKRGLGPRLQRAPLCKSLGSIVKEHYFYLTLACVAVFIYYAEGVTFNIFTVWNMLPVFISFAIYQSARRNNKSFYGAYGFLIGSMLLSGYFHLAWIFDWGDSKTGSSTSGLIFIFIPIYSLITGVIGYAIGKSGDYMNEPNN